ncbi:hypothetical protein C8Q74DRAFT_837659 [Fomes fomentarius]|nr:hypothetical protein C8Q74DRAFT_837659 [Fomes fomentarius]
MTDVNVDSANTTAIEFDSYGSSTWELVQTGNNGAIFSQTLTRVTSQGGAVFRFHGTSVKVFGTLTVPTVVGSTVTSRYTIDNDGTTPFSSASVPSAVIEEIDGQLFFDSGTLSDDTHVLVINVTSASDGAPYLLDYIKYAATTIPDATSSTASPSETVSAIATSPASKNNVGPIVGGVVGGVVGLILIGIGVFLFFRYFRHRLSLSGRQRGGRDLVEDLAEDPKSDTAPSSATIFTSQLSGSPGPPSVPYEASTILPDDSASQVAGRLYAAELARQHAPGPTLHAGSSSGREDGRPAGTRRSDRKQPIPPPVPEEPEPEAVQHQDSGIRFRDGPLLPPAGLPIADLAERPPDYDATP